MQLVSASVWRPNTNGFRMLANFAPMTGLFLSAGSDSIFSLIDVDSVSKSEWCEYCVCHSHSAGSSCLRWLTFVMADPCSLRFAGGTALDTGAKL